MPGGKQSGMERDLAEDALGMAAAVTVLGYTAPAGPGILAGRHSSSQLLDAHMFRRSPDVVLRVGGTFIHIAEYFSRYFNLIFFFFFHLGIFPTEEKWRCFSLLVMKIIFLKGQFRQGPSSWSTSSTPKLSSKNQTCLFQSFTSKRDSKQGYLKTHSNAQLLEHI